MVTFITILQVNLVMSILLYVMVLTYLYGIQATTMDAGRQGQQEGQQQQQQDHQQQQQQQQDHQQHQQQQQQHTSPDPLNSLIIQLLQADLTRGRGGREGQGGGGGRRSPAQTPQGSNAAVLPPLGFAAAAAVPSSSSSPGPSSPSSSSPGPSPSSPGPGPGPAPPASGAAAAGGVDPAAVTVLTPDLLRQHKRYNSPRVLLSQRPPLQPPPLYLMDDFVGGGGGGGGGGDGSGPEAAAAAAALASGLSLPAASAAALAAAAAGNRTRRKRYAEHKSYRGEYSVCDSESQWVTDKSQAVDLRNRPVAVLGQIKTSATAEVKQYFYETRCRASKPYKSGCRGIDDKHWNSQCKTVQTYVRALTQDGAAVGWRWIRIDTSCVCALSRKHRKT